jgi:DNA-binding XRE family transcriptional regulator
VNTEPSSSRLAFFAAELKRLRSIAAMTQEALATAAGYAPATIAAVETCRLLPSQEFAQQADKALSTDGHFARLQALVEQTSVLPWFRDLVETERKAVSIQTYESYIVPGGLCKTSHSKDQRSWELQVRAILQDHATEFCIRLRDSCKPRRTLDLR